MKRELPEGYTVRYQHRHGLGRTAPKRFYAMEHWGSVISGHSTWAVVYDPEGTEVARGVAMCRPEDQFSKRLGRTIALGRALKTLAAVEATP